MKNLLFTLILSVCFLNAQAQQWSGSTTTSGTISRTGNVAIGPVSTIPGFASIYLSNDSGLNPNIIFQNSDAPANNRVWSVMAQGGQFRIITEADNFGSIQDALKISRSGIGVNVVSFPNGNVSIGTLLSSNPNGYKLAVNGKIGAKEVQVENTSATWPDYVFNQDYKLPSLTEVALYIKQNNHLPEIPSATDIERDGHKLGEMNMLLLKKIEELTLYVIELKNQLKMQQMQIEQLTNK